MIFIKKNGQIIRADGKSFNDILVIASESSQTIGEISVPVLTAEDVSLAYNSMVAGKVVAIATENSEILNVNEANSVEDVITLFVYFKDSHIIKYVLEDDAVEITAKEIGSGSGTGAVDSVNGQTGVVVLDADDIIYQNQETIKTALDNLNTAIAGKENTSNKTTTLSSSSTDTQYPSAKAVYDSVEEVREIAQDKVNAFVVDELSDITGTQDQDGNFTSVSAITGIDDLSVLKVGYNIYIKDTSVPDYWVSSVDPVIKLNKLAEKIDLTNLVDLSSTQTITGQKTFTKNLLLTNLTTGTYIGSTDNGNSVMMRAIWDFVFRGRRFIPYDTETIGSADKHWTTAYINNLYGATQNASVDDIIKGLTGMNAPTSTTLTDDQIARIVKGVRLNGSFLGKTTIEFKKPIEFSTTYRGIYVATNDNNQDTEIGLYQINKNTKVISVLGSEDDKRIILKNIRSLNGTPVGNFALTANVQNKATTITDTTNTTFAGSIESNKEYTFSQPLTSLSIVSCEVQTGDLAPIWSIVFTAGTGISVSLPNSVKWANGTTPTFTQGKIYKIMISQYGSNYLAVAGEF